MTLEQQLVRDEGEVLHAYQDGKGYWTIGVGHLIDERRSGEIPITISRMLLAHDIREKTRQVLDRLPWSEFIGEVRRAVLIGMAFNLGINGLLKFQKMLTAARAGDWETAAAECADPNYVADVGDRARRYAEQLRTGEWQ